jgi:hypothetical protein
MQVKIMKWTTVVVAFLVVAGCAGVLLPNYEAMKIESVESTDNSVKDAELADRAPASAAPIQVPQSSPSQPNPNLYRDGYTESNKSTQRADTVINQLYSAAMAFSAPDKANVKEDITIQLLVDPSKEVKELENSLTEPGVRRGAEIKISKVIIATLSAPDFTIEKVTPEEQAVAQTAPTEWLWTITPKSTGKNEVKLTITAVVKVDGKEYKYHIKTYEKTIVIVVKPQQVIYDWLAKYWQWLFSTLLLPLGLWLYKRGKKE